MGSRSSKEQTEEEFLTKYPLLTCSTAGKLGKGIYDSKHIYLNENSGGTPRNCESNEEEETPIETYLGFRKFAVVENADQTHKWFSSSSSPSRRAEFHRVYSQETETFRRSLPDGIFVKAYEDRMDLFSALIMGPEGTPYEGGLFIFDIKLPNDYPRSPPIFHFISFTKERLNPNLYSKGGTVCLSLLGTWIGWNKCEKWNPGESSLLQVLVSIQGLILVPEPFYNEPGYTQKAKPKWLKQSKIYNEKALRLVLQSVAAMLANPPLSWHWEIAFILKEEIPKTLSRIESWIKVTALLGENIAQSNKKGGGDPKVNGCSADVADTKFPEFRLLPLCSVGDISKALAALKAQHDEFYELDDL